VAGSSDYYLGSVTAYANEAKIRLLGVRPETIEMYGAVSGETVVEMARGIRQLLGAEVGIAVSGIAGPSGGSPEKPVGTVWIGLSVSPGIGPDHEVDKAWCYLWRGDRLQVKEQSAQQALQLIVDFLRNGTD
jgi:PncC family amidohydrolase